MQAQPVKEGRSFEIQYPVTEYTFAETALVKKLTFDDEYVHFHLKDARIISVPLTWIPTLYHAGPEQRENYVISEDRTLVIWHPDESGINEILEIDDYVQGIKRR